MIIQLHRQANERPHPLEPARSPTGAKHGRSGSHGISAGGAPEVEDKKKIVVKHARSHVLIANADMAEDADGDEADLDLLSECFAYFLRGES